MHFYTFPAPAYDVIYRGWLHRVWNVHTGPNKTGRFFELECRHTGGPCREVGHVKLVDCCIKWKNGKCCERMQQVGYSNYLISEKLCVIVEDYSNGEVR